MKKKRAWGLVMPVDKLILMKSVTPEMIWEWRAWRMEYRRGDTLESIATRHGTCRSKVNYRLRTMGVEMRHVGPCMTSAALRRATRMAAHYRDGWSLKQLAALEDLSTSVVASLLHRIGTKLRPRGRPRKT